MNFKDIQDRIRARKAGKSEEELIKEDEYTLMANYLSEVEILQKKMGFNRKELAFKIKTSASYLTQVFRGDKPLNFYTIAKMQRALDIRFHVTVLQKNELPIQLPKMQGNPFDYYQHISGIGKSNIGSNFAGYAPQMPDSSHFRDMHKKFCEANSEKLDQVASGASLLTISSLPQNGSPTKLKTA